jgi:hypothetical protein
MAHEENTEKELYDLLVTCGFDPKTTTQTGADGQPAASKVVSFDYIGASGKNYGPGVIVNSDDGELLFYIGDNIARQMDDEDKQQYFDEFLPKLKNFSIRHDFRTFNILNLAQLKHSQSGMSAIREGLFEGFYGTRRVSYDGGPAEARLMIRHNRNLGETDARYRYVESLFVETQDGERFRLPFTNLAGGRAMLEHVRQGGRPYDIRGQHIAEMIQEMKVLARFHRAHQGRVLEGQRQQLVEQAREYYQQLRETVQQLSHGRGYQKYFENWSPATITAADTLVENLRDMFVEQHIDTRVEAALPLLARIQGTAMKEADIFETWANTVVEGADDIADNVEAQQQLRDLLAQDTLPVGADGINVIPELEGIIGYDREDDQDNSDFEDLRDRLVTLSRDNSAEADAKPVIQGWLSEKGVNLGDAENNEPAPAPEPAPEPAPKSTPEPAPAAAPAPVAPPVAEGYKEERLKGCKCQKRQGDNKNCPIHGVKEGVAETKVSKYADMGATTDTTHFLKNITTGKIVSPHRGKADAEDALVAANRDDTAGHKFKIVRARKESVAEQQAGKSAFSPEEIAAINQYLDDEISFIQLRRGYPGVISKAAQQFGIGPVRGFVGEIGFYDRMLQARDEGDIPKQGVAEGDKQTPGIALSKAYEKDFTGKYPGGTLPAATKGKTPGIALSKAYKKDFTGKYPGGELEEGFGRYNITIPSNLLRKIQKIFPKDSVRDIGEWYASAEEYGQPLTVKEYANWRKQGVAEGEYDHSELYNGCYVRDEQDGANGEVFRMSGDPEDRRVRIEDKDGRGWYISPHRLQLVDENDPAVARWFGNSRDEDDLAEGDNLATFVGPNEDSTDVMDHRGAVTDSFTEDLARIKTLALSK